MSTYIQTEMYHAEMLKVIIRGVINKLADDLRLEFYDVPITMQKILVTSIDGVLFTSLSVDDCDIVDGKINANTYVPGAIGALYDVIKNQLMPLGKIKANEELCNQVRMIELE